MGLDNKNWDLSMLNDSKADFFKSDYFFCVIFLTWKKTKKKNVWEIVFLKSIFYFVKKQKENRLKKIAKGLGNLAIPNHLRV